MRTAELYATFARVEARGRSPLYEDWSASIAHDPRVLALIDTLPADKRQPNLVLAASRYCGAPEGTYAEFREWLSSHWKDVRDVAGTRRTQTNEALRCAVLLPLLAALPQPLALLEVGAAAGLCLYPDRWSYRYDDGATIEPRGASAGLLECATSGPVPVPTSPVDVVWRAGIDLAPVDVRKPDDARWLGSLIWPAPDSGARRARLDAGIRLVREDPPLLVQGDLTAPIAGLADEAPADATLVVFHTAVLAYVDRAGRARFADRVRRLRGHWIANEHPAVLGGVPASRDAEDGRFLLTLDGEPRARTGPHGESLDWIV